MLTLFLVWPLFLACVIFIFMGFTEENFYWRNIVSIGGYMVIILLCCSTTAIVALFFSVLFRRTATSLMSTYVLLGVMFCVPLAIHAFANVFYPETPVVTVTHGAGLVSPFSTAFAVPLKVTDLDRGNLSGRRRSAGRIEERDPSTYLLPGWWVFGWHVGFVTAMNLLLLITMIWLFHTRWRVSQ